MTSLTAPQQVKDAFEAVTRAQSAIQTEVNEARREADGSGRAAQATVYAMEKEAAVYAQGVKNLAKVEAEAYSKRLAALEAIRKENPNYLAAVWWDEMTRLYAQMRAGGRLDLLDNRLGADGLDIMQTPLAPKKK